MTASSLLDILCAVELPKVPKSFFIDCLLLRQGKRMNTTHNKPMRNLVVISSGRLACIQYIVSKNKENCPNSGLARGS